MTAATKDRNGERNPSDVEAYSGVSGQTYYKETLVMATPAGVLPVAAPGAGVSQGTFIGVMRDNAVVGVTNYPFDVWKTGEFTFEAQGTGVSADIGKPAYAIDNQTVGRSAAFPRMRVGEITGIPSTAAYRVRINTAVGSKAESFAPLDTLGAGASGQVLGFDGSGGITFLTLGTSTAIL